MQIKMRFVDLILDESEEKTDLHTTDQSLREPSAFPQVLAFIDKVSRKYSFWHCKSSHDVNVMVIPI